MHCVERTGRTTDRRQRLFRTVLLDRAPQCGQDMLAPLHQHSSDHDINHRRGSTGEKEIAPSRST